MLNDTFDNPDEEHVKFCIQWGKQFPHSAHEGLIFVGRANNGWMCFNSSAEDIFNPNNENRAFSRDDQMIWVENNIDYSSTSAFWRVIRKTSRHFFPNNELMHIAWSNLYKIAPDGGNPNQTLCNAQFNGCVKILKKELEIFSPRHVVFLTGIDWAKWFLYELKGDKQISDVLCRTKKWGKSDEYEVNVYFFDGIYFYVTEHPQGKNESTHISALIDSISQNL